ncbi:MAG: LysM peptidoglycan-binding domain-containing protein [Bdellovibrionales bacterium]|nr:LysM peptidoglycan-binding domain-containing protein [Bdellovibrionales bacterium]
MKWISFFLFFCWFVHAENLGIAPFDPDYESRFYSIYQNYHSQQMSISEWETLINQKNVNTYTMQQGDNLWDISRMLFGNSNHWPKLWSVNADLSNPHRVAVGYQVQVIMGSEGQVPRAVINGQTVNQGISSPGAGGTTSLLQRQSGAALTGNTALTAEYTESSGNCVTDLGLILHKSGSTSVYDSEVKCKVMKRRLSERKVKDVDRLNSYYLAQKEEDGEIGMKPFIPPGKLGVIPDSLPPIKLTPEQGIDIVGLGRDLSTSQKNVVVNYQVDSDDIDIIGNVFDVPDGVSVPTSEIIAELDVPANVGDIFSVIHPLRKVRTPSIFIPGPVGHEVIFQGRVRVTGAVPNREGLYFIEVVNMYNDINTDSKLIREAPSVFDLQGVRSGQVRAQVTAIPADQSVIALTVHSFIYINRGRNDNVNVGDIFSIQANPRFHERTFGKSLGRVIIVHTSGDFSTGFVTHLREVAYPGDYLDPLESTGYVPDAEVDDVYPEDKSSAGYDDEEAEFAGGELEGYEEEDGEPTEDEFKEYEEEGEEPAEEEFGSDESVGFDEEPVSESIEEASDADSESILDEEPATDDFESAVDDGEEPVIEEEIPSNSSVGEEESFLDDFEDEELEWAEE